jgi:hypothetical protein
MIVKNVSEAIRELRRILREEGDLPMCRSDGNPLTITVEDIPRRSSARPERMQELDRAIWEEEHATGKAVRV